MNSKIRSNLFVIFIFLCLIFMAFLGYWLAKTTYSFWAYGVQKEAKIIKYEHSNHHVKSSSTYTYQIEIDGTKTTNDLCCKLEEGAIYPVVLVNGGNEIILGKKEKSLFKTFACYMGGYFSACMVLAMYLFFIVTSPNLLIELWRKRNTLYK